MKHVQYITFISFFFVATLANAQKIVAPVSIGELFDKITILEIKFERFLDEAQRANVALELKSLNKIVAKNNLLTCSLEKLKTELFEVNKKLWDIENDIRKKEAQKEFDAEFIKLARSVYITNDERCKIKREINEQTHSKLVEEKQYRSYA